jgi:hypothetical protein
MDTDRARLLDANGQPVALGQADLFPPVRIAEIMAALTMIAELRTVAAPLLDEPFYIDPFHRPARMICVFCRTVQGHSVVHAPDCPVLHRDELLGR